MEAEVGKHSRARLLVILVSLAAFIATLTINALAGSGGTGGPFRQSTGNVSALYETEITPSGRTFAIWGVIYSWLSALQVYILTGLCRRNVYGWMYCSPAVLPYGFFLSWIGNMVFNTLWLFLWDAEQMIAGLFILALVAFTNYLMVLFCCHGLHAYGAWLNKNHRADLWLTRVLVLNGIGVYATWTTIATLLNFTVVLQYSAGVAAANAGTVSLSILLVEVVAWAVVENFVLEKHLRYLLTVYPVVIVALAGNLTKHYDPEAPTRNSIFMVVLLAMSSVLLVLRVALVLWRHWRQPLYQGVDDQMSPMTTAEKQKKIFT